MTRIALRNFTGVKAVFIQDDYRFINDTVAAFQALDIDALFCVAETDVIDDLYPPEIFKNVRRETILTGYVPEHLLRLEVKKYEDRPVDVGYRARKTPEWLGYFGQEKWLIADKFLKTVDVII